MGTKNLELINPVDDACCYRDPRWSPDGQYVLFLFQDIRQAPDIENQLYFVSVEDLLSGQPGTPIPLPLQVFYSPFEQPGPAFRPVQ